MSPFSSAPLWSNFESIAIHNCTGISQTRIVLIRQHAREKLTRAKALGKKVHGEQKREYREETGHESGNSHLHSNQHAFIGSELKVTDDAGATIRCVFSYLPF